MNQWSPRPVSLHSNAHRKRWKKKKNEFFTFHFIVAACDNLCIIISLKHTRLWYDSRLNKYFGSDSDSVNIWARVLCCFRKNAATTINYNKRKKERKNGDVNRPEKCRTYFNAGHRCDNILTFIWQVKRKTKFRLNVHNSSIHRRI